MFLFQSAKDLQGFNNYAKPIVVVENMPYNNGMTKVTMVDRSKVPAGKQEEFDNQLKNYLSMPSETAKEKKAKTEAYTGLLNAAGGAQFEVVVNTTKQGELTANKKDYVFNFSVGSKMSKADYRKIGDLTLASGKPLVRDLDQMTVAEQRKIDHSSKYLAIDIPTNKAYVVDAKTANLINEKHQIPESVKKASVGYPVNGDQRSFTPNVAVAHKLDQEGVKIFNRMGYELSPPLMNIANLQSKPVDVAAPKKAIIGQ